MGGLSAAAVVAVLVGSLLVACGSAENASPLDDSTASVSSTEEAPDNGGGSEADELAGSIVDPLPDGWKNIERDPEMFSAAIAELERAGRVEALLLDSYDDLLDQMLFAAWGPDGAVVVTTLSGTGDDLEREAQQLVADLSAQGVEVDAVDATVSGRRAKVMDRTLPVTADADAQTLEREIWLDSDDRLIAIKIVGSIEVIEAIQAAINL
jgi:hypothetical protein